MALLFLLVCMMVAASLLMAAVSNAGKLEGDRTEQQRYLTLSSALRLVCGELEKMTYTGQYRYARWTVVTEVTDQHGNVTGIITTDHYWCGQSEGAWTGGELAAPLGDFFLEELDGMYGGAFTARGFQARPVRGPAEHTLVLTVENSGLPGLEEPVTVTLRLENQGKLLHLTAALGSRDERGYLYTLEAELVSGGVPQEVDFVPRSGEVYSGVPSGTATYTAASTGAVAWELAWIEKGMADG